MSILLHPKGEIRYGKKCEALVLPPARAAVLRSIEARRRRLEALGAHSDALIPAIHDGSVGFYSANTLRCIKQQLEDFVNKDRQGDRISFTLKTSATRIAR